ncbi:Hpt domain-containing protein [Litorilituus lipolyticus]|uniref:Hpt domain-containing protein n=1 Tax=Litorilituus lipolyticus TaxID=2491017 RepID=A0A502KMV7_9GAMM|nr:Hpt domain-containing protein [Litorilituus lipolyticus]TPH12756.1 Hpt domain-containing protein [Litorilituus lipolyticus]
MNDNFSDLDLHDEQTPEIQIDGIDSAIGINNVLGDEALFLEILAMFYEDHNEDGKKLEQAISTEDYTALKHIVHTLKGVSSSVGATSLFECTKALDEAINKNISDDYAPLYQTLLPEFNKVMDSISAKLIKT